MTPQPTHTPGRDRAARFAAAHVGRFLSGVSVALIFALAVPGCAPPPMEKVVPISKGPAWECQPVDAGGEELWTAEAGEWSAERGTMVSVHRTRTRDVAGAWSNTPDAAIADAVGSATGAALDLLELRGVSYSDVRRGEIVHEAVEAAAEGEKIGFPRLLIASMSVEECTSTSAADTSFRAALLIEYPVGLLKGDTNNALWERKRALREARILARSATDHFERGRWLEGLLDRARAEDVVKATGVPIDTRPRDAGSIEAQLLDVLNDHLLWDGPMLSLSMKPLGEIIVVEAGAAGGEVLEFACSYSWDGRAVAASGVPVRFSMDGAGAVLDFDPVTGGDGVARCRVVAAYGPEGSYELRAELDTGVLEESGLLLQMGTVSSATGLPPSPARRPEASQRIYLVRGAHALSICARFECENEGDEPQLLHGLTRRMERDGYRIVECGPDADVILRGELSIRTSVNTGQQAGGSGAAEDSWSTEVNVFVSAFDQRIAAGIGETTITVKEASDRGRRETEVLALKEAGRLVAAYFNGRILSVPG